MLLLVMFFFGGVVYPLVVTGVAQLVDPAAANGSLLTSANGTVIGSSLLAQNLSAPYLFWERPSQIDFNASLGGQSPYGPADPALVNETLSYLAAYGNGSVNGSWPLDLLSDSSSGVDPDLTPAAVLVQVPRVAFYTNLSVRTLTDFVNAHIERSFFGLIGPPVVNVLQLDLDLVALLGR